MITNDIFVKDFFSVSNEKGMILVTRVLSNNLKKYE